MHNLLILAAGLRICFDDKPSQYFIYRSVIKIVNLILYMPMKDNTTFFNMNLQAVASQVPNTQDKSSRAGSPRRSSLELIRSFARAYHCTRECSLSAGVVLN